MNDSDKHLYWIGRILGAIAVAGVTFGLLWFFDRWELGLLIQAGIALAAGGLFLVFGGSVLRWLDEISDWT